MLMENHDSREFLGSYDHGVLAFRLSADKPGSINVKVSLSRAQSVLAQTASVNSSSSNLHSVVLNANSGQASGAITFWSEARVANTKGRFRSKALRT